MSGRPARARAVGWPRRSLYPETMVAAAERVEGGRVSAAAVDDAAALHWLLRLACAWCFVGHGAWGIYQKPGWLPLYEVFAVPEWLAWRTMPAIGALDIAVGLIVLVHPCRAVLVWMAGWAVFTALLRPAAGMGWWEFLERAGNYAPPLALLAIAATQPALGWFDRIAPRRLPPAAARRVHGILRAGIAMLLIGHGGFGAFQEKSLLVEHWAAVGLEIDGAALRAVGWMEIAAGVAVLASGATWLLLSVAAWKMATELLYPLAGPPMDVFEWVERGGDYFAPLAAIVARNAGGGRRAPPPGAAGD